LQKKFISDLPTLIFSPYETGTTGIFLGSSSEHSYPHLNIHNLSSRSHASEEENRSKCKRALMLIDTLHLFYSMLQIQILQPTLQP
jgi:hypothetical protein